MTSVQPDLSTLPARTLPEMLDAATTGDQFMGVLNGLFGYLEKCRDEEEE